MMEREEREEALKLLRGYIKDIDEKAETFLDPENSTLMHELEFMSLVCGLHESIAAAFIMRFPTIDRGIYLEKYLQDVKIRIRLMIGVTEAKENEKNLNNLN